MSTKPHRWKKRIAITLLVLFGVLAAAIAATPGLRDGVALLWIYNANSFAADEWLADDASKTVSFRHDRHILVPVTVQGEREINIALDTGAPMSALIGGPHLDGLSLNVGRTVRIGGSGQGNDPTAQVIKDLELMVGAVEFSDLTALLIPWQEMGEFFTAPEQVYIHGILGYDLFSRYVVEFDFENESLTLHRPDEFVYTGDGEIVPFTYVQRKPYVLAEVTQMDGTTVPVKLQVDLGQPSALSLIPSAEHGIVVPSGAVSSRGRGLSGHVDQHLSRIGALRFGKQELRDVVTAFSIEGFATSGERNGVVGLDVLARFRVIFDYPRDRMILEPREYDHPFEDDMSGIIWIPQGDSFLIRRIREDSPAANAGLQMDDELISIDGADAVGMRLGELFERMRSGDGEEITLRLRRNAEIVSTVLTLRRRV